MDEASNGSESTPNVIEAAPAPVVKLEAAENGATDTATAASTTVDPPEYLKTDTDVVTGEEAVTEYVEPTITEKRLAAAGVPPRIVEAIKCLGDAGIINPDLIEDRALRVIARLQEDHGVYFMEQFKASNLIGVANMSSYFGVAVKGFHNILVHEGVERGITSPVIHGPSAERTKAVIEKYGYPAEINVGYRKMGPKPGVDVVLKPGCQLYVGHLPFDVYEDQILELFLQEGDVHDVRLMMNTDTMHSKGFAFVTYVDKEVAAKAASKLDGHTLHGNRLRVNVSIPNTRLFVGNVPKNPRKG